jgi:AbrB family looped-hinge helix DNA binding protein
MEIAAKMSSKGQITVPKAVRDALGIGAGDSVVFRVEGNRAVLARTPDFLSLAGTFKVPAARRNAAWDDVIRTTRSARADARR